MSANVQTMFSVRETPWHGLVEPRDSYPSSTAEARTWAGCDWDVYTEPLYDLTGVTQAGAPVYEPIAGYKQIKRDDTGARLSVVSETYTPVTNEQFWEIAEAVFSVDAKVPVQYETAGVLDSGRRLWALCRLGDTVELPGDSSPRTAYLFLASGHDGKTALRAGATDVRIVCQNTEHLADIDAKQRGTHYTFKHTRNVDTRIADCQAALTGSLAQVEQIRDHARSLLGQAITAQRAEEYITQFAINRTIGNMNIRRVDYAEAVQRPSVVAAASRTAAEITAMFESQTCTGIRGNAYGLWAATVEWLDYGRPYKDGETLFTRTMMTAEGDKRLARQTLSSVLS